MMKTLKQKQGLSGSQREGQTLGLPRKAVGESRGRGMIGLRHSEATKNRISATKTNTTALRSILLPEEWVSHTTMKDLSLMLK